MKDKLHIILALVGVLFGVMTLKTGGMSLFTEEGNLAAGDYVPFVLWFNFLAGFFYIVASVGNFARHPWGLSLTKALAISTGIVFLLFLGHVALGGAYKTETVVAMIFRGSFWAMTWVLLTKFKAPLVTRL